MQEIIFLINFIFIIQIDHGCAEHLSKARITNFVYFNSTKAAILIQVENLKEDIDLFRECLCQNEFHKALKIVPSDSPVPLLTFEIRLYIFLNPISHLLIFILDYRCVVQEQIEINRIEVFNLFSVRFLEIFPHWLLQTIDAQEVRIYMVQITSFVTVFSHFSWNVHF